MATTLEEIKKRREERQAAHEKARTAQELADLEAIDALEAASAEPLHTMTANSYRPGVVYKIAFRSPTAAEYRRYCDMAGRALTKGDAKGRQAAQEMLAESCLVYPAKESDARKALLEQIPGVLISLAIEAARVAEHRSEEEGKG